MTLAPADLEALLVGVLDDASTKIPNPRPTEFTRVTRAGGPGEVNEVQGASRMLVECFATSSVTAWTRAATAYRTIRGLRQTLVDGVWIARVELTDPTNLPDNTTGMARYQFVAQLTTTLQEAS